jgi:hypothetical protein
MSLQVTDCPHPVGTKEHSAWIVEVYIPSLDDDRREQDRLRAGAEAIGGKLVNGQHWRNPTVGFAGGAPVSVQSSELRLDNLKPPPEFAWDPLDPNTKTISLHWHEEGA